MMLTFEDEFMQKPSGYRTVLGHARESIAPKSGVLTSRSPKLSRVRRVGPSGLLALALSASLPLAFSQLSAASSKVEFGGLTKLAKLTKATKQVKRANGATTTTVPSSPQPVGDIAGPWNLAFDSEFNGSSLDASQWSPGWFGSSVTTGANRLEQECMDPAQVSLANGALHLSAVVRGETCGGISRPYASGIVTTDRHFSFTYGYMEARIWLPGSGGIADWPAFWAVGQKPPTGGEIDVVEGIAGRAVAHFHNSAGSQGPIVAVGTYAGGWHTFAADWEPGSITYYYDGAKIGSFTSGITSAPMYLILNLALSTAMTSVNTAPATMQVDYVRVWQHNGQKTSPVLG